MSDIRTVQAARLVGLVGINGVARAAGWTSGLLSVLGDEILKAPRDSMLGRARSSNPSSYYRLGRVEAREMLTTTPIKGVASEEDTSDDPILTEEDFKNMSPEELAELLQLLKKGGK